MFKKIVKLLPKSSRIKINFYRNEIRNTKDIPLSIRLKMWKRGIGARNYYYFNIKELGSKYFLSKLFNNLSHPKNGIYSNLIDNKLYMPYCLKDFKEFIPEYYYIIKDNKIMGLTDDHEVLEMNIDNFRSIVLEKKKMIGKRIADEGGEGVHIFEAISRNRVLVNGKEYSMKQGFGMFKKLDNTILTEFIKQHPYAKKLNPTTVNSIRLTTGWDVDKNEPFIFYGIQKMGTKKMFGPDNGAQGGLMADLDINNGSIGKLAIRHKRSVEFVEEHPESGIKFTGEPIPHFDKVKEDILNICRHLNFIKYIGWDLIITDDSFKVLEMNSNPDQWASQMYLQWMKDKRTRKFYEQFVNKQNENYFMK